MLSPIIENPLERQLNNYMGTGISGLIEIQFRVSGLLSRRGMVLSLGFRLWALNLSFEHFRVHGFGSRL